MRKLLPALLLALSILPAFAETDPPVERASGLTVLVFVVLFIGGIAGYFAYVWWSAKRDKALADEAAVTPPSAG
jgi:hypothetical protein